MACWAPVALSKRKLSPWFLFGLLVIIGWVSFRIVSVFIDYTLIALFLAYLTYPAYPWLRRYLRNRQLTAMVLLAVIVIAILVPLGFLVAELAKEMQNIAQSLGDDEFQNITDDIRQRFNEWLGREGADGGDVVVGQVESEIQAFIARTVTGLFGALAEAFVGIFVLLYVMYYAYVDGPRLIRYTQELLPMQEAHRDLLFHEVGLVVKAVMYGQVLTALIQALIGGVGFWIFGIENVVFWSVVMFILALLPIVGPPLVWGPAAIYLWIVQGDTFSAIGLAIYSAILVSTVDNIIRPKLIGSRAHVHPVVILLGVLGGLAVFGFSGLILGPLVLSIFVTILDVYRKEFATKMDDESGLALRR